MRYLYFLIFLILLRSPATGQTTNDSTCTKIQSIIHLMGTWKKGQPNTGYPLLARVSRRTVTHPMLLGANRIYYSNAAKLPGEYAGEFGIDDDAKCSFTAYLGPYPAAMIAEKGIDLKQQVLACINSSDWQISDHEEAYLFMSYKPVDVTVSILRMQTNNPKEFILTITMFRFTPLH